MGQDSSVEEEEEEEEDEEEEGAGSLAKALLTLDLETVFIGANKIAKGSAWTLLLVAMLIIGIACLGLVHACEGLATQMGIAPYFVAVVLASAATSVPDTIISYRDALNGEYDDAVANALGSNIFDVCFALGLPLFVYTVVYAPIEMPLETVQNVAELRVSLFLLTAVAFLIFYFNKGLGYLQAVMLLAIYVLFTVFILSKAYDVEWAIDLGLWLQGLIS